MKPIRTLQLSAVFASGAAASVSAQVIDRHHLAGAMVPEPETCALVSAGLGLLARCKKAAAR